MKIKEYIKLQKELHNIKRQEELEKTNNEDISINEYRNAEFKTCFASVAVWFSILILLLGGSIAFKELTSPIATTPTQTISALKQEPLLAHNGKREEIYNFNPNNSFTFHNYTQYSIDYYNDEMQYNKHSYGNDVIDCPYNSSGDSELGLFTIDDDDVYWLDDNGSASYGATFTDNEDLIQYNNVYAYEQLNDFVYLDLHAIDLEDMYGSWLYGCKYAYTQNRSITRDITFTNNGNFSLDFNDDYAVIRQDMPTFNKFHIVTDLTIKDYTYITKSKIYAQKVVNNVVSYSCMVASNYVCSKYEVSYNSNTKNLDLVYNIGNGYSISYDDNYYLAPYINSTKIDISSSSHLLSSSCYGFRGWLSNSSTSALRLPTNGIDDDTLAVTLWSDFGNLVRIWLYSMFPIMTVTILPGLTIGALIIAPIIIMLVAFMLKLVKKN